jgi:formylglycine-generating enzyme required for sulfatase activity
MEWCWDWYWTYPEVGQTDYLGSSEVYYRVVRGGTWNGSPGAARSGNRSVNSPADIYSNIGFRLLRGMSTIVGN